MCSKIFLEHFFEYSFTKWLKHHLAFFQWKKSSKESLLDLKFPFDFRAEQRKMAVAVYKNISEGVNLFSRAPTGTGKTLASIFPALKTMGEDKTEKIFYLTAKTVGRTVAEKSIQMLQKNGAQIRYCVITAKEKSCLKEFALCDPDYCEYTHDFYTKVKIAIEYALSINKWNFESITNIAKNFQICPFELSLTLSQYAEIIICDYNYCFDPVVQLKRHFDGLNHSYTFLIDEAHNLTDRAREMYSGTISSDILKEWIEIFPNKKLKIFKELLALNNAVSSVKPLDKDFFILPEFPLNILKIINSIINYIEKQLEKKNKAFTRFYIIKIYFQLIFFLNNVNSITKNHVIYFQRDNSTCLLKVFCVNPREKFAEYLAYAKSAIFFSATLHPFSYFSEILAAEEKDKNISLLSPFKKENFALYIYSGINTLYQFREDSYKPIADLIFYVCSLKKGNYIIYFPSFSFLQRVYDYMQTYNVFEKIVCQKQKMSEKERESFLNLFENTSELLIAFAVLGGLFSEGIDLTGDKLIGCMVISVGLPSLGGERTFIKDYYDHSLHKGFEYAYRYPGFNKVMQAAGRVIRSEEDKGWVILVDQRYAKNYYKELYPPEWRHYKILNNQKMLLQDIKKFWNY